MEYSRFNLFACAVAAVGVVLSAGAVWAELAEFELSGSVTAVGSNGDPSFLESLADLGVAPGAPLEAMLVYDTDAPLTELPGT